jgi:hypothetical protein
VTRPSLTEAQIKQSVKPYRQMTLRAQGSVLPLTDKEHVAITFYREEVADTADNNTDRKRLVLGVLDRLLAARKDAP